MQFSRTTRFKQTLTFIWFFAGWMFAGAQTNAVSPLTVFGLGDLSEGYFAQNFGIGGCAISVREPLYINLANPASYTSIELTTLETAVSHKFIEQTVESTNQKLVNQSTYFNYFSLGFKLKDWWGMSLSIAPYSFVGYNIQTSDSLVEFGEIFYEFDGNGGVNQAVIGNAFEPIKNLSIGFNIRYLFGSFDKSEAVVFRERTFYNAKRLISNGVSSFAFDYGIQYTKPLENNIDLIFGATYANAISLNANQNSLKYSFIYNTSGIEVPVDTLSATLDKKGTIFLPSKYGVGMSLGKKHDEWFNHAWMVSGEFTTTQWSKFRDFDGENGGLDNSWRVSVGGFFVPRFTFETSKRAKTYFSVIEYRFGGFYENTQISLNNKAVINYGGTLGFGFPIAFRNLAPGEKKSTMINFGIVVGNKGNGQPDQLNELYTNIMLGITLGDQWFQKFKYR